MRILVIEDNQDIAANLGDFLEDRGHTVDFAADGVTGLHLAVVHDFDAIVLDLNLPREDGLTLCRDLRARGEDHIPVLMLTARGQQKDREMAERAVAMAREAPVDDMIGLADPGALLVHHLETLVRLGHHSPPSPIRKSAPGRPARGTSRRPAARRRPCTTGRNCAAGRWRGTGPANAGWS